MSDFVTVLTLTYLTDAHIIQGRLEAEGIECLLSNEMTTQVAPLYTAGSGGISVQVKEEDLEFTIELLKEFGYIREEAPKSPKFIERLERFSSQIPYLNRLRFEYRLFILIALPLCLAAFVLFYINILTPSDKLMGDWCVDEIVHNGQRIPPHTVEPGFQLVIKGVCKEKIWFLEDNVVHFPGFDSQAIIGNWELNGSRLEIRHSDEFDHFYDGIYTVSNNGKDLKLISDKTQIYCYR